MTFVAPPVKAVALCDYVHTETYLPRSVYVMVIFSLFFPLSLLAGDGDAGSESFDKSHVHTGGAREVRHLVSRELGRRKTGRRGEVIC